MKKLYPLLVFIILACPIIKAQSWSPVASGMNNGVNAFAVYNNELYAGGLFTTAGGVSASGVAKWDGSSWSAVGGGISGFNGAVIALVVYKNELYAGGVFSSAGGLPVNSIAKWNGSSWSAVGGGVTGWNYSVNAFAVYNNELYVGGSFELAGGLPANSIAKWNGSSWSVVGGGMSLAQSIGSVYAMAVYNNELWAGGLFLTAGGIISQNLARWNGATWSSAGVADDRVFELAVYNNALYAGGWFTSPGNAIAKWNGSYWSDVGGGMNISNGGYATVLALSVYGNELYVGGEFYSAGNINTNNIAKWNDTSWSAIGSGTNGFISGLGVFNEALYAGGWFTAAGSISANNIAKWSNCNAPVQPEPITGNTSVCTKSIQTYSISPVIGATSYTWTLPSGWTGSSTTTSITATAGNNGGNISVTANNDCSTSSTQSLPVTVNNALTQPDTILGITSPCTGSTQVYSVSPVSGATSYTWALPSGWTGSSTTNSISVNVGNNNGIISVSAGNSCDYSVTKALEVTIGNAPSQPGAITGSTIVNAGQNLNYSINPVNGATGYNWSLSGGGTIISGQNTTSVTVNWLTTGNYTLSVNAINACGVSSAQTLNIAVSSVPDNPFDIKIMPNPSAGEIYLKAKGVFNKLIRIELINITGQLIYRDQKRAETNDFTRLINLSKVAAGVYEVKIFIDEQKFIKKIVRIN